MKLLYLSLVILSVVGCSQPNKMIREYDKDGNYIENGRKYFSNSIIPLPEPKEEK